MEAAEKSKKENRLHRIYGGTEALHLEAAMKFYASGELLEESLLTFYESLPERMKEIKQFLSQRDYENYTIRIHALKSGARLIGATEISELAEQLEHCGDLMRKEGNGTGK